MAYLKGIDVSHWQGTTPSLSGLDFLFARSTYGTSKDDKFEMHEANAKRAGLVFGAYHFGNPSQSVSSQLAACLAATQGVRMVVLDIEANNMTLSQAKVFIAGLRAAGKWAGVYHSLSGYPWDLGQDFDWLAAWGYASIPGPWEFWQYRGSPLDLDYYKGTLAQLQENVTIPYAPATDTQEPTLVISDPTPLLITIPVGIQLYDASNAPLVKVSVKQNQVFSPWGVEFSENRHMREISVYTGGQKVVAYVHASDAGVTEEPVPVAPPVTVDDGYTKATQDAAVAAQAAADKAVIDQQAQVIADQKTEVVAAEAFKAAHKNFLG